MCSETSSPRISFSHGLAGDSSPPVEQIRRDFTLMDSNLEFEFSISSSIGHESSSADELFGNGIILPIRIQKKNVSSHGCEPPFTAALPPLPPAENSKDTMKKVAVMNSDQFEEKTAGSKSFWGFKRSSSLNFESRRPSLCPIPLLSRSNSTGSVPNPGPRKFKDSQKQISTRKSSSFSSSSSYLSPYPTNVKPQLRKNPGGVYGQYQCISPVLNVASPKFFGLGSLMRCGKDKKGKK